MGLLRYADSLQIQCFGVLGDFVLEDKRIAITHGDDKKLLKRLISEAQYDFIIHGHTADVKNETHNRTKVITPGVIHNGPQRTALLLDTSTGAVKTLRLPDAL